MRHALNFTLENANGLSRITLYSILSHRCIRKLARYQISHPRNERFPFSSFSELQLRDSFSLIHSLAK